MSATNDPGAPRRAFLAAYAFAHAHVMDACSGDGAQAGALLDRFVFLCQIQSAGRLAGDPCYLSRAFSSHEGKPSDFTYHSHVLHPLMRALAGIGGAGQDLLIGDKEKEPPLIPNLAFGHLLNALHGPFAYSLMEEEAPGLSGAIGPDAPGAAFETLVLGADNGGARTRRRGTGSYYTARAVARFMCREALGEYLAAALAARGARMQAARDRMGSFLKIAEAGQDNPGAEREIVDETEACALLDALRQSRICDPAAGAGAFLAAMLQLMLRTAALLHRRIHGEPPAATARADLARHFIARCLHGVDIQPRAARLCAMRLWLALMDARGKADAAPGAIAPLPRLKHNIVRGDSLLQEREACLPGGELWSPFIWRAAFGRVFREKGGFDILIGNPPYGFRGVLDAAARRAIRKDLGISFPSGDMAEPFITAMPRLAGKPGCVQAFLAPKKSLYGESWSGVRESWRGARVLCLADAGKAFPGVLLEQAVFVAAHGPRAAGAPPRIAVASLPPGASEMIEHGAFTEETIFHPHTGAARIYRGVAGEKLARALEHGSRAPDRSPVRARIGLTGVTSYLTDAPAPGDLPCIKGADIRRWGMNRERWIKAEALAHTAPGILARHTGPAEKVVAQKIIAHIGRPRPHIRIAALVDRSRGAAHDTAVIVWSEDPAATPAMLCAWLNSAPVGWYAWNITYNRAVRTMDLLEYYLRQIPFPGKIPDAARRSLEALAARAEHGEPVQWEMDEIICSLYGLSPRQTKALLADQTFDA